MMKKIAIPTREGMIDDHFGHCAYYTVFTLDEQNQVIYQEQIGRASCRERVLRLV